MAYSFRQEILTHDDLVAVTNLQRPTAQAKSLTKLGIDFKIRPDGTLLVLWDSVRRASGLSDTGKPSERKKPEVRTDGILGVRNGRRAA